MENEPGAASHDTSIHKIAVNQKELKVRDLFDTTKLKLKQIIVSKFTSKS